MMRNALGTGIFADPEDCVLQSYTPRAPHPICGARFARRCKLAGRPARTNIP
jgi:hypothetical protein